MAALPLGLIALGAFVLWLVPFVGWVRYWRRPSSTSRKWPPTRGQQVLNLASWFAFLALGVAGLGEKGRLAFPLWAIVPMMVIAWSWLIAFFVWHRRQSRLTPP